MLRKDKEIIIVGLVLLSLIGVWKWSKIQHFDHPTSDSSLAENTAMVTNLAGNSGGTGVIFRSNPSFSQILTNAHVCGVVKKGGIVHADNQTSLVTSFQISNHHDLCLISVHRNLHHNTEVSSSAPELYSNANVSGHPSLLPVIITRGHFSEREFIQVMTGFRECTENDWKGENAGFCMFFGVIPVIREYEAQVTSATISPGSSGSAVFDHSGRIAGLVFAGSGPLGYGHLVPQEYLSYFVNHEIPHLPDQFPVVSTDPPTKEENATQKLRQICSEGIINVNYPLAKDYCEFVNTDVLYVGEENE